MIVVEDELEHAWHYYSARDVEIKLLLQTFNKDIEFAIDGTVESYSGPLPQISEQRTIEIYREIILRRMHII
jgi:hypothetical protein